MKSWKAKGYLVTETGGTEKTYILLTSDDGTSLPVLVLGNHSGKEEDELITLAKEAFFREEYVERSMGEAVEKVAEMEAVIAEANLTITQMKKQMVDQATATEEAKVLAQANQEAVNSAVSELTNLVMNLMASVTFDHGSIGD